MLFVTDILLLEKELAWDGDVPLKKEERLSQGES